MLHIVGFPHSDTCGSTLICSSPQLFAACRVLLRLPMPRHSPCALSSLNFMSFANRSNGFSCLLIVVVYPDSTVLPALSFVFYYSRFAFSPFLFYSVFKVHFAKLLLCNWKWRIENGKCWLKTFGFLPFFFSFSSSLRLFVAWWAQVGSNHRPRAYQARALACWAMSPCGVPGLCLPWWRWRDSNSWPPACRAGALPAELHPRSFRFQGFPFTDPENRTTKSFFKTLTRTLRLFLFTSFVRWTFLFVSTFELS